MADGDTVTQKMNATAYRVRFSIIVTLVSIALSLAAYASVNWITGLEAPVYGWAISVVIPSIVAPIVSWISSGLIQRLRIANNELARVQAKFESQSIRQRQVFRRLSHELRTPAAAIHMISGAPATYAERRDQVREASRTLLYFLDSIQAAINARETVTGTTERFFLARLRDDLEFLGQALSSDTSVRFAVTAEWSSEVDHAAFEADYLRIRACVMNLVRNALIHSQARHVTVKLRADLTDNRCQLAVGVEDDGVGIAPEQQANVLKPYGRGETKAAGSGLGLAIVQDWLAEFGSALELS